MTVALGTVLYFLSVRRFKKSWLFELLVWSIGVLSALFFLFGDELFTVLRVYEKPQVVLESTKTNGSVDVVETPNPEATPTTPPREPEIPPVIEKPQSDPEKDLIETLLQEKQQTQAGIPPTINILSPQDGDVFPANIQTVEVKAQVTDDTDPNPIVEGLGRFVLKPGFNAIIVTAVDKEGNASHEFIVIQQERQKTQ